MIWLLFAIGFYVIAAMCIGSLLRERTTSGQLTYLVAGIAGFFMAAHSLIAATR